VKDENSDLLADSQIVLLLLNVHNVSDVMQIEVHMAELLVPGRSCLEAEIAVANLKKYILPGSD
jgi:hypothetical protein